MNSLKWVGALLILLGILIAAGLAAWEPLTASRAAPPPPHRYDTVIARDRWGVPHIFGRTDPDVAYGIGYAHAEDDFATLQEVMAMTRARLGAITGAAGAKTDYVVHLLGARATVDRDYDRQPSDVRALLDGYASGLNLYAARHPEEVKLARLFPVNGRDVAVGFVVRSPFFFGLENVLGALADAKPLPAESAGRTPDAPDVTPVGPSGIEAGSNAFAISPWRSSDGTTRLVSNAHQPWRGGVAWYELVVHSGQGWNFAGATFPGAPYPLLGHGTSLGWTNTVDRPDLTDIYRLTLNEAGNAYRFNGRWRPIEAQRVWLPVKLWGPFVLPVPKTVHRAIQGPVIENRKGAFAIRYAGADQMGMVEEYYRLQRARDWREWSAALAMQAVPATNFVYADATGRIAHIYNAAFPNRRPGFDYARVLPGDTSADYQPGTVPWRMVPQHVDPPSGFLVNANSTPFQAAGIGSELDPRAFSPLLGIETDTTNRSTRALELFGAHARIGERELEAIKYDTVVSRRSWAARWIADLVRANPRGDRRIATAQALLGRWDWSFDGHHPGQALAALLMRTGQKWHYQREPESDPRKALLEASAYLMRVFHRLDPPLGAMLRLRQGRVDLPLDGGPDVLRAMALWDEAPDGRLAVRDGDSFVMFMAWDQQGRVSSRSIQPFGTATTRPNSPHYTDQAPLFAAHRTKPVLFTRAQLRGNVERIYRP
ncbi:penicillin acylase family protein [Sphingomonas sp. CROZ-RG-20F-R02-07]|uniref:penicillin acylase family protein n=1 Tax=Sphingomonas sp. CROZ-RG-20F-R02-07 TaxID=2914832 RepID=UPI001F5AE4F9|nr:penicillin acylase family protein [Sphingomonas sp. CROZ-RG-20F-R02-07]